MSGSKRSLGIVALIVALTGGAGCSGSGGGTTGGSCGAPTCGGDLVGHWVASSACIDSGAFSKRALGSYTSCSGASISQISPMPTGDVTFNSDSTYTISLSMQVTYSMSISDACFDGGGCNAADFQFIANVVGNAGVGSVSCGGSTSCSCNGVGELNFGQSGDSGSSGTYSLSGSTVSISSSTGTADSGSYCVQGNTLHLMLTGMSSGMSIIPAELVFSKD